MGKENNVKFYTRGGQNSVKTIFFPQLKRKIMNRERKRIFFDSFFHKVFFSLFTLDFEFPLLNFKRMMEVGKEEDFPSHFIHSLGKTKNEMISIFY